ncbi:MAG TPA: putative LPS assembly protein LptD [Candidatus Krumholzibacteria bacterium]|nr:putative LPS assembly protein LptD [Candidatus Krumholzibacteria bacterium]HRX51556.1 putative LPS assembly protein LptD [Candidatus Krumholzibacteria bacterium]
MSSGVGRLLALLGTMLAVAGAVRAAEPTPTRVDADRLVDRVVDGQPITYLLGNVLIVRDSMTVAADSALFYREDDEYDFFGRVRMTRGEAVVTCRAAFYNDRTGDADFRGDVRMVDGDVIATGRRAEMREEGDLLRLIRDARVVSPDYVVHADTVVNRDSSEQGEAFGHVIMVDPGGDSVVRGGHAVFDRDGGRVTVDRLPSLESRDGEREPLVADALLMDFLRDEDLVVMVDSVRIRQGATRALADTARVYGRELMRLTGRPVMDDGEGAVFRGTVIETWYEDGEPVRVRMEGEASVEDDEPGDLAVRYPGLPEMDVLSGDTITVHMREGRPHRSVVVGRARSVYVPVDAAKEVAFNDVRGDTILIAFADKGVRQVDVRGSMTGTYSFMRLEELGARAAAAAVVLDSVLAARGDTLAALLPDSLAASLPTRVADWSGLDPLQGAMLARALVDSLTAHGDTALVYTAQRALADALRDTLADGRGSTVDFTANRELVDYSGGQGLFQLADKRIVLRRDARLLYGSIDLKAQDIRLETGTRELYATGTPLLVDGGEKIAGRDMAYDFGNRTGAVKNGVTSMDGYFYVGRHIKRFGDGELKIRGGKMTSCDLDRPHYHFWADKMKIKMDDKVVAKPIVLKVGEVPLFALPFFFKSLQSGRRSGILFPTFDFGWGSRTGRYIRDWGYYWATNDYTDFTVRGDWNERSELTWQISNRYIKRYAFQGDVRYSRRSTLGSQAGTRQWQFFWNHNQPALFDVYNFKADVRMSSTTIERTDLLNDVGQEVINGQQVSNVNVSRRWSFGSGNVSFKREEYVNAADTLLATNKRLSTQAFPSLAVSFTNRPLASPSRAGSGGFLRDLLSNTYFQHSYGASRQVTTFETTRSTLDRANGNMSLTVTPPTVSVFNVSTGLTAGFTYARNDTAGALYDEDADAMVPIASEVETTTKSLAVKSDVSTTLYGLFRARVGSLRAVRHTLRMSASHRWRPELDGVQTADQSVSLSMGNRFDLKFRAAETDSGETYRKLDGVVDWSLNTTYDPDLEKKDRWGDIGSVLSLKPGSSRYLNVSVTNSYDPYAMHMKQTTFRYSLDFSGRFDTGGRSREDKRERNAAMAALAAADSLGAAPVTDEPDPWQPEEAERADDFGGYGAFEDQEQKSGDDQTAGGRFIPWRLSSSLSYSKNHVSDVLTARMSLNASVTLTRAWSASWRGSYDFQTGLLTSQTWNLERDLHCWNMRFSRSVSSVDSQFGFIISLRAISDIKVTRGRSDMVAGGLSGLTNRLY